DFLDPVPAMTMLLWDDRADSPHGGNFLIDMGGFPNNPGQLTFTDSLPASYHHQAAGVSYVDGHAELHRWVDLRTMPVVPKGTTRQPDSKLNSPNNRDIMWLQERTT